MSSDKTLILIRHAHRPIRRADNGLSLKGQFQTRRLTKYFSKRIKDKSIAIYSSPKKRCIQTLGPLSKLLNRKIRILVYLSEEGNLAKKVTRFSKKWKNDKAEITIACSHGDWIPFALNRWVRRTIEIKKGGAALLVYSPKGVKLKKVIQKF